MGRLRLEMATAHAVHHLLWRAWELRRWREWRRLDRFKAAEYALSVERDALDMLQW